MVSRKARFTAKKVTVSGKVTVTLKSRFLKGTHPERNKVCLLVGWLIYVVPARNGSTWTVVCVVTFADCRSNLCYTWIKIADKNFRPDLCTSI